METSGKKVIELNIEDVLPNRFQPRIKFNEEAINELSKSIKEHGVIQPIVVRPIGDKFEIIAGERRYKASCMADLKTIPAIITDLNDKDSAEVALIENVQRENLTPIEEAISYKKILDMGYITQDALASKLGKTQSTVANKLRLLNLDDEVQEALLNEKISERHARSLLRLTDKTQQKQLLNRIISERLTVRKTDDEIEKILGGTPEKAIPTEPINTEMNIPTLEVPIKEKQKDNISNIQQESIDNQKYRFINMPIKPEEEQPKELQKEEHQEEELKPGKFFNILDNEEEKQEEPEEQPTEAIFNFDNIFNQVPTSELESKSIENNAMLEELNEIENSINNSETIPPIFEEPEEKKEQQIKESEKQEEDNFEDEFIEEIEEEPEEQTTINERIEKPETKINNFKDVLQTIRECSEKIEDAGFIIDTEEIDLDNEYQVIFKIEKMEK